MSALVNAGGNGRLERQAYATYLIGLLDDLPRVGDEMQIAITKDKVISVNLLRSKI